MRTWRYLVWLAFWPFFMVAGLLTALTVGLAESLLEKHEMWGRGAETLLRTPEDRT